MNRLQLVFVSAAILAGSTAAQIRISVPTDPDLADRIARIQVFPASLLEKELPDVSLGEWLLEEAGPDARIWWSDSPPYTGLCRNNTADLSCACGTVSADVRTWDGRTYAVSIAAGGAGSVPTCASGIVASSTYGSTRIRELHDLPRLLWKDPRKRRPNEAMK
jgi:hypothetical protein